MAGIPGCSKFWWILERIEYLSMLNVHDYYYDDVL